jgi:PQQ-like domain
MALTHRRIQILTSGAVALALLAGLGIAHAALGAPSHAAAQGGGFNTPGNILISDQFNNRVIEVNPTTNQIVWSFGSNNPSNCNPGPGAIIGLNDAERLSQGYTLLAGTGVPGGSSPADPSFGCVDNRVIVVDQAGDIVWQYGQAGQSGDGPNLLNVPVFAIQLPNHNIMIVDQSNERVIEVGRDSKQIVWSYGCLTCNLLNNPNSAELLANGHILIADENNNRVIEITRAGQIVWQYSQGISFAAFASRLPNGDTLIVDSGNSRILEVTPDKQIDFQYFTNTASNSNSSPLPTNAVRLATGGDTVIADQFNHRAIMVDRSRHLEYQYGMTNVFGNGPNQLDGPYTAFVIGDYTGQTPPPPQF